MKILWIVNMVLPDAAEKLGVKTSFSGSWLVDPLKSLSKDETVELATMTYGFVEKNEIVTINNVRHYIFPGAGKRLLFASPKTEEDCQFVLNDFKPDIIHIYGTEYSIGYSMLKIQPAVPVLLTVQGILANIAKEYPGGLPWYTYYRLFTFKQLMKAKLPMFTQRLFIQNARREQEVISGAKHITGRTEHDRQFVKQVNPQATYYQINYNLRAEFYQAEKWNPDQYMPYTIFTGAATYPLKGLHKLIDALAQVKKTYPNVKLLVPGNSTSYDSSNGYERFIRRKIRKLGLEENVQFVGRKTALGMIECLQKAHIYVFPSAYDTDSLSLCEAQLIGTPVIASNRGGSAYLVEDQHSGLCYDYEDVDDLAGKICRLFADQDFCRILSENEKNHAENRHDREKNVQDQKRLYEKLIEKSTL